MLDNKCDRNQIQNMINFIDFGTLKINEENLTIGEYLLSELKVFETNFQVFLRTLCGTITVNDEGKKIDISKDTLTNQYKYMQEFLNELDTISGNKKYNLLSFNYTFYGKILNQMKLDNKTKTALFQVDKRCIPKNCNSYFNIHGQVYDDRSLETENILIGINNTKNELKKFSKVKRLEEKGENWKKEIKNLLRDISTIKFYGHSLSLVDYPYFKYIFDIINLSKNKNIIFELGYSDFDNAGTYQHEILEKENFKNLLNKYSDGFYERLCSENRIKCFQL